MKRIVTALLAIVAGLAIAESASACSIVISAHSLKAGWQRARDAIDSADLIVDGEVVRRLIPGQQTGLIKVHRVHKGPAVEFVEVESPTTCNHGFEGVGERGRYFLYLHGGPQIYIENAPEASSTRVDRLLGSDRRKDWPYRPAGLQTPGR